MITLKEQKELITNANSSGYILDYYGSRFQTSYGVLNSSGRHTSFDINNALTVIRNDPVVKAAIITLVDKTLESGWRVTGKDKRSRIKELEQKLLDLKFNSVLRKVLYNLFLYNNAFVEIVKKGDEVTDLNVLETTLMEIMSKDNGDVLGYKQLIPNTPTWTPDKVVHLKFRDITSNVWAEPLDIQSLYETALLKDYIRQWLTWFFGTNQLRPIITIESGANDKKIKDFLSYLKASEKDISKALVLQGKVLAQALNNFNNGDSILKLLNWCDEQILMLLQVPPIAVGMPDNSGRSNSNEQYQALNTTVHAMHILLEDVFTYDLFPKINFGKVIFDFGVVDQSTRLRTFEIAEKMKNMLFTDEAITEFLESQGVVFNTKTLFKEPPQDLSNSDVPQNMRGMIGNKPQSTAASKQTQDDVQVSKKNQQVMVKNSNDKFNQYPYTYEVRE